MQLPNRLKSQHWLFGLIAIVSGSSVLYTALEGEALFGFARERQVESQDAIEVLTDDMKRLMKSVNNWQAVCQDPYAYFQSAGQHGNFAITIMDDFHAEDRRVKNQFTRDAMMRCMKSKNEGTAKTSHRLCLAVDEKNSETPWFDNQHLIEVNIEFREGGSKLISNCDSLEAGLGKKVEIQSFFSAYSDQGMRKKKVGRVSSGLRFSLNAG